MLHHFLSLLVASVLAVSASAELTVAPLFGDHMVLQQMRAVPVWGTAEPGQKVRVSIENRTHEVRTDEFGSWRVDLPAMSAAEHAQPVTLTIGAEGEADIVIEDVMIGEVWLASGQSNMEWPVSQTDRADEAISRGPDPQRWRGPMRAEGREGSTA